MKWGGEVKGQEHGRKPLDRRRWGRSFHFLNNGDKIFSKGGSAPSWGRVVGAGKSSGQRSVNIFPAPPSFIPWPWRPTLFLSMRLCALSSVQ